MAKQNRDLQALAQLCHILGDKTRLCLLHTLRDGAMNVTCLCKSLKLPQPTVSRHLAILRMAGLVENLRVGKEIHYSLNKQTGNGATAAAVRKIAGTASAVQIGPLVIGLTRN